MKRSIFTAKELISWKIILNWNKNKLQEIEGQWDSKMSKGRQRAADEI